MPAIYHNCLGQALRACNLGGLHAAGARCEDEFRPLMGPLANEFNVAINYANPQEHAPEAKRSVRVVKEQI